MSMRVTIIHDHHGDLHVHREGCKDMANRRRYAPSELSAPWTIEAASRTDVAGAVYGPASGSFYEENGGDETYGPDGLQRFLQSCVVEFQFANCVRELR